MNFSPWQQQVFDRSVAAHRQGRLGHALLLTGPGRMGKGEVADALARRLLCAAPAENGMACGHCRACRLFAGQTHGDFLRVGLELNDKGDKLRAEIGVEQIRRLGHWFSLTPQLGGARVVLIEPGDAMNVASSNALLKTLEEPAAGRYLLIVTARPGRLPATIRSRCQRLEFRLPLRAEAEAWLRGRGLPDAEIGSALDAARGHPGLASEWIEQGGLRLRRDVSTELNALATGRASPVDSARRWLADEQAELRLRFAADLVLEAAWRRFGTDAIGSGGLTAPTDFSKLSAWFGALNRVREQLSAPVRSDLVLAGLLLEWRTMVSQASAPG